MRNYESLYIIHQDVVNDELDAMIEKFKGVLTAQNAEIHMLDNWGVKKLAYPIKKVERGSYIQTYFRAEPEVITEFERRLRLDENVLRFLTIKLEGDFPVVETAVEEAPAAEAAPAPASADEE